MQRYLFVAILLLSFVNMASAQTRGKMEKGWLNYYVIAQSDYHLNMSDVGASRYLSSPNGVGGQMGVSLVRTTKHRMILSSSTVFKFTPQQLIVDFPLSRMGYATDQRYRKEINFTNLSVQIKLQGGYSLLMGRKSALEMRTGVTLDFPVDGQYREEPIYQSGLHPQYNELVALKRSAWGNKKGIANSGTIVPLNALFEFNMDYRLLEGTIFKKRSCKLGLNLTTYMKGNFNNKTEMNFYSKDRSKLETETFSDKHLSAGLSLAMEI